MSASVVDQASRSEEHTSELQSCGHLVCRLLLEKKNHYGGMKTDEVRRLKELERENDRLEQIVAELTQDNKILKEATAPSFFLNEAAPPEPYTLSLHDALPI